MLRETAKEEKEREGGREDLSALARRKRERKRGRELGR